MAPRNQLDLVIGALVLIRRASSAIDTALGLPAQDRAQLESNLEQVRNDLTDLMSEIGGSIPGAAALSTRPEVKMAAGVVEFFARHSASQLGAVAGVADTLRSGGDSRVLSQRIERHLNEVGVASREDLAELLGLEPNSAKLQESIERTLGCGRAEWYGPDLYGVPRIELEDLAERTPDAATGAQEAEPAAGKDIGSAVSRLESSLQSLGSALGNRQVEPAGDEERADSDRIRELRRLADDGLISEEQFEQRKSQILDRL